MASPSGENVTNCAAALQMDNWQKMMDKLISSFFISGFLIINS
jgi:hypothetical protein